MIDALQFVRGAVSRKDLVPVLAHFQIRNGYIKSFNGVMGLCSPIPLDLDAAPNGTAFVQAIEACTDTVALFMAENGKLVVRSDGFQTMVDCVPAEQFPDLNPEGKSVTLDASLLPALTYLEPFVASDASRPWACGVLFDGDCAHATNNVVLQQFWLGFEFPFRVNIPHAAVRELIRIGKDPISMQVTDRRITFHYEDKRWLSTQLLETKWPEIGGLLENPGRQEPFPEGFFEALEKLSPFCDDLGRVYFFEGGIATSADPASTGTSIELRGGPAGGIFNILQLLKLKGLATTIDFSAYPNVCMFYGERARGVIAPIRA